MHRCPSPSSFLLGLLAVAASVLTPAVRAEVGSDGYTPGRGLALLNDRLVVGGYAALNLHAMSQETDQLAPDDLSIFLTFQPIDHFKFFGEFEVEDAVRLDKHGLDTGHDVASLERLYTEWEPSNLLRLRVGKMLTPIGIWNVIHAAPLVWTVSRPLATTQFFDTGVTGATLDVALLRGDIGLTATTFGQGTDQLDDSDGPKRSGPAGGGRLELAALEGPRLGLSYVRFDNRHAHRWESTFGGDFFWETSRFELSSEVAINDPDSGSTTWGAYLQGVYNPPWTFHLHPVLRIEYVDLDSIHRTPFVFGMAWKPNFYTVVKAEGIVGGEDTDLGGEGFLASLAVLF